MHYHLPMIEFFFASIGTGMLVVLALFIAKDFFHLNAARVMIVLLFAAIVHFLHPWTPTEFLPHSFVIQSSIPALFWLACRLIFNDNRQPNSWFAVWARNGIGILALYSFLGPTLGHSLRALDLYSEDMRWFCWQVPQWCEYLMIALGLREIVLHWDRDFILVRRRMRAGLMLLVWASVGWAVMSFNFNLANDVYRLAVLDLAILIVAWFLFQARNDLLLPIAQLLGDSRYAYGNQMNASFFEASLDANEDHYTYLEDARELDTAQNQAELGEVKFAEKTGVITKVAATDGSESVEDDQPTLTLVGLEKEELDLPDEASQILSAQDQAALTVLMESGFYRQEKLTLGDLSSALDIPEYRLRAVINKKLGFNNFNEYLNGLRIAEAAARLLTEPETPISNIALDVGYRTLSSFNRAFKRVMATTPTLYRTQKNGGET